MMLRPRQALLVERSLAALHQHGDTLAIGPTGSGKTIMLSAVAGGVLESRTPRPAFSPTATNSPPRIGKSSAASIRG